MKTKNILSIILCVLLISSCQKTDNKNLTNSDKPNSETLSSRIDTTSNKFQVDALVTNSKDTLSQWIGTYKFDESWKELNGVTSAVMNYTIKISRKDGKTLTGKLSVDGFQTMIRKNCTVEFTENKLNLYSENDKKLQVSFEKTLPESS